MIMTIIGIIKVNKNDDSNNTPKTSTARMTSPKNGITIPFSFN